MFTSVEVTLFVHGNSDDPFFMEFRGQLREDMEKSEQVTKPIEISGIKRCIARIGKYIW